MPASGKQRTGRKQRALRTAKRHLAGESLQAIAASEGISRRSAERDLQHPAVRALMAALVEEHAEDMKAQFREALKIISAGMGATKVERTGPRTWRRVPDHMGRLAAVDRHLKLLTLARNETAEREFPGWTWQEFVDNVVAVECPEELENPPPRNLVT